MVLASVRRHNGHRKPSGLPVRYATVSAAATAITRVLDHRVGQDRPGLDRPRPELSVREHGAGQTDVRVDPQEVPVRPKWPKVARRVARPRPVGRLVVAPLEAEPPSFGSWRPNPGSTPARPGKATAWPRPRSSAHQTSAPAAPGRTRSRSSSEHSLPTPGEPVSSTTTDPTGSRTASPRYDPKAIPDRSSTTDPEQLVPGVGVDPAGRDPADRSAGLRTAVPRRAPAGGARSARRARGVVEPDGPLLDRDQHGIGGEQLGHRCQREHLRASPHIVSARSTVATPTAARPTGQPATRSAIGSGDSLRAGAR